MVHACEEVEGRHGHGKRRRWLWRGLLLLGGLGVVGVLGAGLLLEKPIVTPENLYAAVQVAIAKGSGPGRDPICVANGLAYDLQPVYVQTDNAATVSWMATLVKAGLYAAPEPGVSGGDVSKPVFVYRPGPTLAQWGGQRRLCIASGLKLKAVTHLTSVGYRRLRGERYSSVTADLQWVLDGPAPWLAMPGVGEALAQELPPWHGARWQRTAVGWSLTQRAHFVQVGQQWVPDAFKPQSPEAVRSPPGPTP